MYQKQKGTREYDSIRPYGDMYKYRVIDRLHGKIINMWHEESYTKPKTGRFSIYFVV